MPSSQDKRAKVFISYSHKDGEWLERVQKHLRVLERDGLVEVWDDTKLQAGTQWREEINNFLGSAGVAILLISVNFFDSDFIAYNELPFLLDKVEKDGLVILPLILSPSRFEKIESLSRFMTVNPTLKPLIELSEGDQERYLVKLSDDVLRTIEEAPTKPASAVGTERRQILNLPFPRNEFFTDRDDILSGLYKDFNAGKTVQALNGIGGVGKTQTALEYAYRYQQDYQVLLWSKAHTRESLVTDFAAITALLDPTKMKAQDQNEAVNAVKRWLENHGDWLLILDNVDDWAMAREFIPMKKTGHVLLTTCAINAKPIAAQQEVEMMNSQEGALLLLHRLGKIKKGEPLESAPKQLKEQAESLSKTLDGLPLALDQAASFIEDTPSTLEEYQTLYQNAHRELLKRRGLAIDHESVTVTFSLAFEKVTKANSAAADLLRACAFLKADSIPEEIFSRGAKELGEAISSEAEKPIGLSDAIKGAGRFSLLRRDPEARAVSLHQIVQVVLKDEMDNDVKRMWAERAIRAVNSAFPDVEYSDWPLCAQLIPHALLLESPINDYSFEFPEAGRLLNQAGSYLYELAQYDKAESLLTHALKIRKRALRATHPDTAVSLSKLARLYKLQGKYSDAEPFYYRALEIRQQELGDAHRDTLVSFNKLGEVYRLQGRYDDAESLIMRALESCKQLLKAKHPDTEAILNIGNLYISQGRYDDAESVIERAVEIREGELGRDHPDTGESLRNRGNIYRLQRRYSEAESDIKRVLDIVEQNYGPEHPYKAATLNNQAEIYADQGKYKEAEPLYRRALKIRKRALGAEHPATAKIHSNLAKLYVAQERYEEAERHYRRALKIRTHALGAEHPDTVTVVENLAALLCKMGR